MNELSSVVDKTRDYELKRQELADDARQLNETLKRIQLDIREGEVKIGELELQKKMEKAGNIPLLTWAVRSISCTESCSEERNSILNIENEIERYEQQIASLSERARALKFDYQSSQFTYHAEVVGTYHSGDLEILGLPFHSWRNLTQETDTVLGDQFCFSNPGLRDDQSIEVYIDANLVRRISADYVDDRTCLGVEKEDKYRKAVIRLVDLIPEGADARFPEDVIHINDVYVSTTQSASPAMEMTIDPLG
ncbi:MAG: hypothetical protein AAFQ67_08435 [Pseudomonadota bacterium]